MYVSLPILLLVVAAVILWLKNPIQRTQKIEGIGWVREINLLGLFINVESLSNRFNKLDHEEASLRKKLKKVVKDKEDEKKYLDSRIKLINDEYRAHLRDWNGKRHWKYLFRIVPIPAFSFMEELEKGSPTAAKDNKSCYSLDDLPHSILKGLDPATKSFVFRPKPRPPQNQKGKGNNQQQNQQQKQQQSN